MDEADRLRREALAEVEKMKAEMAAQKEQARKELEEANREAAKVVRSVHLCIVVYQTLLLQERAELEARVSHLFFRRHAIGFLRPKFSVTQPDLPLMLFALIV